MDHGSQPKSRLAAVTFARELLCLSRAGVKVNITSQWQDPVTFIFLSEYITKKKIGCMLKHVVSKFRHDLSIRLKDIAEKQVPAKLKPIISILSLIELIRY